MSDSRGDTGLEVKSQKDSGQVSVKGSTPGGKIDESAIEEIESELSDPKPVMPNDGEELMSKRARENSCTSGKPNGCGDPKGEAAIASAQGLGAAVEIPSSVKFLALISLVVGVSKENECDGLMFGDPNKTGLLLGLSTGEPYGSKQMELCGAPLSCTAGSSAVNCMQLAFCMELIWTLPKIGSSHGDVVKL